MTSHLGQHGIPGHIQNVSEAARPHSDAAVGGLASGGGGLLTIARPYIFTEPFGVVSHFYVQGGALRDRYTAGLNQASGWARSGAPPFVAPAILPGCKAPPGQLVEGIGPATVGNYVVTTNQTLHMAPGDFSACFIWTQNGNGTYVVFQDNGPYQVSGYFFQVSVGSWAFYQNGAGVAAFANRAGDIIVDGSAPNIACVGLAGATLMAQVNGGPLVTAAALPGTYVVGSGNTSLGAWPDGSGGILPGPIYEAMWARTPASAALFSAWTAEAHGRLGITAW